MDWSLQADCTVYLQVALSEHSKHLDLRQQIPALGQLEQEITSGFGLLNLVQSHDGILIPDN